MKKIVHSQKTPLAVTTLTKGRRTTIVLFSKVLVGDTWKLVSNISKDGKEFSKKETVVRVFDKRKKEISAQRISAMRFSNSHGQTTLVVESLTLDGTPRVSLAESSGIKDWKIKADLNV